MNGEASDVQVDPRVLRSTRALGHAMATLLAEQRFDKITVQQILDRASVSRATFYKYFRGKDDALFSSYEGMFSWLEAQLDANDGARSGAGNGRRLAPVAEFLGHLDGSRAVVASLRGSDRMEEIWELGVAFMAAIIDRRLRILPGQATAAGTFAQQERLPSALAARMLSGAVMEMAKWWLDRPGNAGPEQMDAQFHLMAHRAMLPFGYGW